MAAALCVGLTLCASGCRKKVQTVPPLPPIQDPVALVTPSPTEHPQMIEPMEVKMPPVPVASNAARPRRERKKSAAKPAPEPTQAANTEPPAEGSAIGALTSGGEANPRSQQEAADMITANEKRLNALPSQIVEEQKAQISKVKNFQRQAQEALNSGDVEGAKTLATKAKLLLDDLSK
jgi:ribosomal protein S20